MLTVTLQVPSGHTRPVATARDSTALDAPEKTRSKHGSALQLLLRNTESVGVIPSIGSSPRG